MVFEIVCVTNSLSWWRTFSKIVRARYGNRNVILNNWCFFITFIFRLVQFLIFLTHKPHNSILVLNTIITIQIQILCGMRCTCAIPLLQQVNTSIILFHQTQKSNREDNIKENLRQHAVPWHSQRMILVPPVTNQNCYTLSKVFLTTLKYMLYSFLDKSVHLIPQ